MQAPELAIINWRQLATEQKRYPARILAMMVNNLMFPNTGMKLPTRVEQGQTELKILQLLRLAA